MNVDEIRQYKFYEGQELEAILIGDVWTRTTTWIWSGLECVRQCKSITVVMEDGQMSGVPWVVVKCFNGKIEKYNIALVTGVVLKEKVNV